MVIPAGLWLELFVEEAVLDGERLRSQQPRQNLAASRWGLMVFPPPAWQLQTNLNSGRILAEPAQPKSAPGPGGSRLGLGWQQGRV